ncbi:MAG: thermonuclease family protein [Pseudomonadota bacterium]
MFGWRRRNDGFEWHKYVRTTIKLRREDRKKRIEDIKEAAAAGVVDAGKASATAGRSLLHNAFVLLTAMFRALGRVIAQLPSILMRLLKRLSTLLQPVGRGLAVLASRSEPTLSRPGIPSLLLLFALASLASGIARAMSMGPDWGTVLLLCVGAALAFMALMPILAKLSTPAVKLPVLSLAAIPGSRSPALRTALATAVFLCVAGGVGWALWPQMKGIAEQISTASLPSLTEPPLEGRARAVTGDTLLVAGQVVRLSGIEAPELTQACRNARRRRWRCGRSARQALSKIVGSRKVSCSNLSADSNGFKNGTCRIGENDIAMQLLRRGHAFSTASSYGSYSTEETAARTAKVGIWSGKAQLPEEFREASWASAKDKAPDGCPIKGRVTRGGKIYLLPWSPSYRNRKVRKSRGERWFCSESDALAAGWKPDPAS